MNHVTLYGNIGTDPNLRYTESGMAVCNFSLATNEGKDKEGAERPPMWHRIVIWDKSAENAAQYLAKGSPVIIEGRISYREYMKDDQKQYSTDNVATRWYFAGKKEDAQSAPAKPAAPTPAPEEDLPF